MRYDIIQTGSDGNATVINDQVLIDIGVSWKKLKPYTRKLKLVLLTHEHRDHFNPGTAARLHRDRPSVRFACGKWMVADLIEAGISKRNIDVHEMEKWSTYGGIATVSPFEVFHNVRNCGWRIFSNGESALYATDLGAPPKVLAPGCDLYFLEANHREAEIEQRIREKLEAGEFTYETAAIENHLSYEKAIGWLSTQMGPRSIWVPMHGHQERRDPEDGQQTSEGEHLLE